MGMVPWGSLQPRALASASHSGQWSSQSWMGALVTETWRWLISWGNLDPFTSHNMPVNKRWVWLASKVVWLLAGERLCWAHLQRPACGGCWVNTPVTCCRHSQQLLFTYLMILLSLLDGIMPDFSLLYPKHIISVPCIYWKKWNQIFSKKHPESALFSWASLLHFRA